MERGTPTRASAYSELAPRLAHLDEVTVGVADVGADLPAVVLGFGEELSTFGRPFLIDLRDVGHPSAWMIGAVCPARDTGVALVMTRLDTAAMNLFLAELGQAIAPGAHGIVLMDKAGWHTSGDLVVPENLSLIFLPPYSPELNPIERLWLHLRDNRLSHCVFQTTDEIVDSCCDAWNWLLGQTGRIRSLCSYPWLERVNG